METTLSKLPKIVAKSKKRLGRGRGSGAGEKSGRGTTRHQIARTKMPLHFEGGQGRLVKKFPLLRGKLRNRSVNAEVIPISLDALNTLDDGTVVTIELLAEKGIIHISSQPKSVKILAAGTLSKKLSVALPVSEPAKKAIEDAGGSVQE